MYSCTIQFLKANEDLLYRKFNCTGVFSRGRHQKRYSVIAITLRYDFALSHNASTLSRKVIASFSYRSGFREIVIAYYSYRSSLIVIVISSFSYRSKVTKSLSLITTTLRFLSSGVDLTGHTRLERRIWEMCYGTDVT